MKKKKYKFLWLFCFLITVYLFNIFAYEIESLNARVRNFIVTGNTSVRNFNFKGLPISSSPNVENEFVSPFYVVHYGLIYSKEFNKSLQSDAFHWKEDTSIKYWNIPPENIKKEYFKNCADWLVENVDMSFGYAHYIYDFNWKYKGYKDGKLEKPWWSGLTDAYAIVLLLRAYDVYNNEDYLKTARLLYESALKDIKSGGSLTFLNNKKWIEEYVDPKKNSSDLAFVLNGMIYSTFGIKAYEDFFNKQPKQSLELYKSIEYNIEMFDKGSSWSNYDLIGNAANMKYHKIHIALMHEMFLLTKSPIFKEKETQWKKATNNIGYYWVMNSNKSMAKNMYIFELIMIIICYLFFYFKKLRIND